MKKLLLLVAFMCITISGFSQNVMWFKATALSIKVLDGYSWSDWSPWEPCSVKIKIDIDNDVIVIYSNHVQVYQVIEQLESPYDASGEQLKYGVIDQENDYGTLRLRVQNNGNMQLYVDFADIIWVYNVIKI